MVKVFFKYSLLVVLALSLALVACDDERYMSSLDAELTITVDTLMFDTIFTTVGSTTRSFKVINPYDQPLLISSITLCGGHKSNFKINIDGALKTETEEIELPANDSLFVFVEVTIDPNGANQPMIVADSIEFISNGKVKHVTLMAWGQDFIPIEQGTISTTTWTADKPYVIYDYAVVDSGQVLTIEPGTRVFFHKDAIFYVKGAIKAKGSVGSPILFSSDKREKMFENVPDQWWGILVFPSSEVSRFENVEIRNANIGLQAGTIEQEGAANIQLHNVKILNMAYAGIFALKSNIVASNTLVANCGFYCVTLLIGGNYQFTHTTLANYWNGFPARNTASLVISNQLKLKTANGEQVFNGPLAKAEWRNSIIWGNLASEVEFGRHSEFAFNYMFDHCIVKLNDTIAVNDPKNYNAIMKNVDPGFVNPFEYKFMLDTLSVAKDAGRPEPAASVPLDIRSFSRLSDDGPDIGAFERIEKQKKSAKKNSK